MRPVKSAIGRGSDSVLGSSPDSEIDAHANAVHGDQPLLSFFIPDLSIGGAERVTLTLVNEFTKRGHNVELLLSRFQGELTPQLDDRVQVTTLSPSHTSFLGVGAHLPAIANHLRSRRPAVLFPQLCHPSVVCLAVNKILKPETAVIPTQHSTFGSSANQTPKDQLVDQLAPRLYLDADRIITVSEGVATSLVEQTPVRRSDISVLHNPVDVTGIRTKARASVEHRWFRDKETEVIAFAGRIAPEKDLKTWLRAFAQVHERRPETRALIAGDGPSRQELLEFIEDLGIGKAVWMPGYVENPYRFMQRASAFMLSSQREGLPTVLIEALACGCPIVATDCRSGPREILEEGALGPLVPVGEPQTLARGLEQVLDDPVSEERLRARAEEFSPEVVLGKYERFIDEYVLSG